MRKLSFLILVLVNAISLSGCSWDGNAVSAGTRAQEAKSVIVRLINTEKKEIGMAVLTQIEKGVLIQMKASELTPGRHGFHVHEKGACEAPDFKLAGEHFNPFDKKHGFKVPQGYHAGDLPNIIVGKDGKVSVELFAPEVTLEAGQPNSLLREGGTALIIHKDADDYVSQPSGNAGDRIACGEIR